MTPSRVPDLEPRFLQPEGWRWHIFTRQSKRGPRKIRFGSVFPKGSVPDTIVVCLPGLSEFGEKYYEVAQDCLNKNLAFWVIDWMGQGRSGRYFEDLPQRRHAYSFDDDLDDLEYFIRDYVVHSSVHPDVGRIPMAMLAHSMGGHIGLRYLAQYPERFTCAAISAPMLDIMALPRLPLIINAFLTGALRMFNSRGYVPGGGDWSADMRPKTGISVFSSDPEREQIHNAWCAADPALQIGSVTYGWLYSAVKSCLRVQGLENNAIKTPCLIATAGLDSIVGNAAIERFAARIERCRHECLVDSQHEILMERDEIRNDFLDKFYALVQEKVIEQPETLKPF